MDDHAVGPHRHLSRRSLIATGALAAGALGASAPTIGTAFGGSPARAAAGVTKKITIYAEQLPGNLFGYGLAPGQATVPGPDPGDVRG